MARKSKGTGDSVKPGISKAPTVKTTFKKGIKSDSSTILSGGIRKAPTVKTKVPGKGYK